MRPYRLLAIAASFLFVACGSTTMADDAASGCPASYGGIDGTA